MARGRSAALALSGIGLIGVLASCSTTARVIDVYTALDGEGERRRQVFYTDTKELHCVTEAAFGRKGATMEILFRQLQAYDRSNQKYFDTDRVYARAEFAPSVGAGRQYFSTRLVNIDALGEVSEDAPLDPGRYECEVYLDGVLEDKAVFNIMFPECPAAEIIARKPCYGFFEDGRECPRYGLTSGDPSKCTCRIPGWECL